MSSLLLLPAWFAAFVLFRKLFTDAREAALASCVTWAVVVFALTEVLSLFHALSFLPLLIVWGVIAFLSLILVFRSLNARLTTPAFMRDASSSARFAYGALIAGTFSIFVATLIVALASPPNNWDSMTYHMARVANWIDHRSIRHYPTHIIRQLYLGPWAESAITHLQILTGSDRLANLVQFVAMLGSAFGASLVAKKLGAERWGQLFAFVYCATIPIGILEASTTQNDYVTAFWFLCFINFTLDLLAPESESLWSSSALAGASLGLAILTKITSLIFATPFFAWLSYFLLRTRRARGIPTLALMAATALCMNAGHFIRNVRAWGSPLAPAEETATYRNEIHTPAAISSNLIRNIAVHLAVPKIGPPINKGVVAVHSLTGLQISDPRTTAKGEVFRYSLNLNENSAGNPFHLLIGAFCVAVALWAVRVKHVPALYTTCLIIGFVLFCGYLRWQPWISRLHLPLFVAGAPLCGWVFSRPALRRLGYASSIIAILIGLLYATRNDTRPLLGRDTVLAQPRSNLYFASRPTLRQPFLDAADEVARGKPELIGLVTGIDDWEYPFRVLVRMRLGSQPIFEHINVQNESRTCPPETTQPLRSPDKIVVIGSPPAFTPPPDYVPTFTSQPIRVFAAHTPRFLLKEKGVDEP
jgi:Dolichyl-phosphate-mannose-protein mannosyltransferase